jgi:hypothetical protein
LGGDGLDTAGHSDGGHAVSHGGEPPVRDAGGPPPAGGSDHTPPGSGHGPEHTGPADHEGGPSDEQHGLGDHAPSRDGQGPVHAGETVAASQHADEVTRLHADDRPGVVSADHGPHGADNWGYYKGEEVHYAQNPIEENTKALRFYEDMRDPFSNRGNVETIAENTGMKPSVVQTAKENLFLQRHDVETELGITRRDVFFTPDELIADLWRKAEANTLNNMQQAQFRNHVAHEYVENKLMELGMPYRSLDPRVWEGDSAYLSDHNLIGAHDAAPAALRATPMVTEGVGALSHWRKIGIEPPAEPILDDLSNVDTLVDAIKKGLNL